MSDDTKNDENAPPVGQDEHLKKNPSALEARLSILDPELKEAYEKAMADKHNAERNFRTRDEELRKTQQKLNELVQKEQKAETDRLAEEGKFKELAEKAEARASELETKFAKRAIRETVSRELAKAGALDEDVLAEHLISKYSDVVKFDGDSVSGVTDLVNRMKEEKPLLFKVDSANVVNQNSAVKSTGSSVSNPQPGVQPTKFNALDRNVPIADVEKAYADANKHLGPNIRGK